MIFSFLFRSFFFFFTLDCNLYKSMLLQMTLFHFLWQSDILLFVYIYIYTHIYIPHLLYLLICWLTLRCFHVLAIVNNATMNLGMYVSFWIRVFISSGYMPSSGRTNLHSTNNVEELSFLHTLCSIYYL